MSQNEILADLLDSTSIKDTASDFGHREIEINDGINSVFVDIDSDAIPLKLKGSLNIGDRKYELEYTLEYYDARRRKAEYVIELI